MREMQDALDSGTTDGSPHLKHPDLHRMIVSRLEVLTRPGRWLDIGAGHGAFIATPHRAGMTVVATEMSRSALARLRARYPSGVEAREATDTDMGVRPGERFAVISCISVLHHIPDYIEAVDELVGHLEPGGAFVCFQDPLFYPRLSRASLWAARIAYYSWRVTRGDVIRGISTTIRRALGQYDESNRSDMVEYHVVRQGVNEQALLSMLESRFNRVTLIPYWSTQGALQQRIGEWLRLANTFGIVADGYRV